MSDDWEDVPATSDDWQDDSGEWVDESPKEAPGVGTRALQGLSKFTKLRDMLLARHPLVAGVRGAQALATGQPYKPLVKTEDFKKLVTTWEGGLDASDLLARAGASQGVSKWGGLAADMTMPDPIGNAVLGQGIKAASIPFRAAGLRGALSRIPWRQRPAVMKTLVEEGVAGGAKTQAEQIASGIEKYDNAVSASAARGDGAGQAFKGADFNAEASSLLDELERLKPVSELSTAKGYASKIAEEQVRTRKPDVSLAFANRLRKSIGSTGDEALQQIRKMLRDRLVGDAGPHGAAIDQGLIKESHLLRARGGAEALANRPWYKGLGMPALGAAIGGGRNIQLGDDFSLGPVARGAFFGAIGAKALTSPAFLTRGAQGFEAASPWLGNAAIQSIYRSLPEEENQ